MTSGSPFEGPIGFSRAVRAGDRVLVSGTGPTWPDGSCDPDVFAQAMRAFKIAGGMVLREAARRADAVLLEPVMEFEIITPEEFMGDVMGDATSRRGRIERIEERTGQRAILVLVPLAELFGYATDLRSKTQGRASHTPMQLHAYMEVPAQIAKEIVARVRGE